jgi:hypothetical protein
VEAIKKCAWPDEERTHRLPLPWVFHSRLEAQPARAWFHALRSRHLHVRGCCSGESAQAAAVQGVRGGWQNAGGVSLKRLTRVVFAVAAGSNANKAVGPSKNTAKLDAETEELSRASSAHRRFDLASRPASPFVWGR